MFWTLSPQTIENPIVVIVEDALILLQNTNKSLLYAASYLIPTCTPLLSLPQVMLPLPQALRTGIIKTGKHTPLKDDSRVSPVELVGLK